MNPEGAAYRTNAMPPQKSFIEELWDNKRKTKERLERLEDALVPKFVEEIKAAATIVSHIGREEKLLVSRGEHSNYSEELTSFLEEIADALPGDAIFKLDIKPSHPGLNRRIAEMLKPLLEKEGFKCELSEPNYILVSWGEQCNGR